MAEQPPARSLAREPVDSDVDLHRGRQPAHRRDELAVLLVVSVGGSAGAGARYLLGLAFAHRLTGV